MRPSFVTRRLSTSTFPRRGRLSWGLGIIGGLGGGEVGSVSEATRAGLAGPINSESIKRAYLHYKLAWGDIDKI